MISNISIDLNADLGEFPDASSAARDAELMQYLTSANIACGGHAGDEGTIRQTIRAAQANTVAIGAHPSFPDRQNFGRLQMSIALADLEQSLIEQMRLIVEVAQDERARISHVKPHGALYHAANRDEGVASCIARAAATFDPSWILVGQYGSPALTVYGRMGFRTASEAFVDRRYERDGSLRDRRLPGAVLHTTEMATEQALNIALRRSVLASDGSTLDINADTICLHSDTPDSVTIARAVKKSLLEAGVHIRSFS